MMIVITITMTTMVMMMMMMTTTTTTLMMMMMMMMMINESQISAIDGGEGGEKGIGSSNMIAIWVRRKFTQLPTTGSPFEVDQRYSGFVIETPQSLVLHHRLQDKHVEQPYEIWQREKHTQMKQRHTKIKTQKTHARNKHTNRKTRKIYERTPRKKTHEASTITNNTKKYMKPDEKKETPKKSKQPMN